MPSSAVTTRSKSMPAFKIPDVRLYSSLRKQVGNTLEDGRRRAQDAVEQEKTLTYWQVGQLIDAHVLQHADRGDYGKQVLKRLAVDLSTNQTLLYYALQFARSYPKFPAPGKLTWSHYRALLPVKDAGQREKLESSAESWGWSSRRLEEAVSSSERRKAPQEKESRLQVSGLAAQKAGEPYIYQLCRSQAPGANPKSLLIDLGFAAYLEFSNGSKTLFSGDFIRSVKKESSEGPEAYRYERFHGAAEKDLYFYRAWCEKIVDEDTAWMQIDLGFGIHTRQKLRLRAGDAPENDVAGSLKSRKFLQDRLRASEGLLIRTVKSEKYGRYLADVFTFGRHLNPARLRPSQARQA